MEELLKNLFAVPKFSALVHSNYFNKNVSYFSGSVISWVLLINVRRMNQYFYYAPARFRTLYNTNIVQTSLKYELNFLTNKII